MSNQAPGESTITPTDRWKRAGHRGGVLWFTGLSASGKTTLSRAVERELFARAWNAFLLDGDLLRRALNADLGYTHEDRSENIRRTAEVARLLALSGQIAVVALISPYRRDRERARAIAVASGCEFIEIFVDAPLAVCETRDPKGLYRQARAGELRDFTGVDAPYEAPETPEIHLRTAEMSIAESTAQILDYVLPRWKC